MHQVYSRFMDLFDRSHSKVRATDAEITEMENELDTMVPESYRAFVIEFGGAFTPSLLSLVTDNNIDLFDIQNIVLPRKAVVDTKAYWEAGMPTQNVGFANDCMGNMFCFHRIPRSSPRPLDAPVYLFDHDFGTVELVAPSMEKWLQTYVSASMTT
jgi:SMI1 / KNR4 family (SUKH-1)